MTLDLAPLDDVVGLLQAALRESSVSTDRADISTLPGVWVRLAEVEFSQLDGGHRLGTELVLITAEQDTRRALDELAATYRAVVAAGVHPDGVARSATMPLLDGTGVRYPVLVVPVDLTACAWTAPPPPD